MVGYTISKIKQQQDVDCNQVQQKAFAALDCGPFALAHAKMGTVRRFAV